MRTEVVSLLLGALIGYSLKKEKIVRKEWTLNDVVNYIVQNVEEMDNETVRVIAKAIIEEKYDVIRDMLPSAPSVEIIKTGTAKLTIESEDYYYVEPSPYTHWMMTGSSRETLERTFQIYAFDGIMLDIDTTMPLDARIYIDGQLVDTLSFDEPRHVKRFYEVEEGIHAFRYECGERIGGATYYVLPAVKRTRSIRVPYNVEGITVRLEETEDFTAELATSFWLIPLSGSFDINVDKYRVPLIDGQITRMIIPFNRDVYIRTDIPIGIGADMYHPVYVTLTPTSDYFALVWVKDRDCGAYERLPIFITATSRELEIPYILYNIPLDTLPPLASICDYPPIFW